MMEMDWTNVILGVLTLLGGCGWVIDRKKHRQEIESMKADIRQKELDLGTDFVKKFRELIAGPLEEEVGKLRNEVKDLRNAIEGVYDCSYRDDCPVRKRMRKQSAGGEGKSLWPSDMRDKGFGEGSGDGRTSRYHS